MSEKSKVRYSDREEVEEGWTVKIEINNKDDGPEHTIDVKPDPLKKDTDGDGFSDSKEKKLGTDPTSRDTDQDGISDPDEVRDNSCGGYFMRGIDRDEDGTPDGPLDWDSDGDGHVPSKNHPKPYIS